MTDKDSLKKVLILRGKHNTSFFDVSTEEKLHKVCLSILKHRFSPENIDMYFGDNKPPKEPECSVSKVKAEAMPDTDILKQAVLNFWNEYEREMASYLDAQEQLKRIKQAIALEDGVLAYKILMERSTYEYEEMEIEYIYEKYK